MEEVEEPPKLQAQKTMKIETKMQTKDSNKQTLKRNAKSQTTLRYKNNIKKDQEEDCNIYTQIDDI